MATQIPALTAFSSSLVDRVDLQVLQQRAQAIARMQQSRRLLFTVVPIAGLLTLFAAAILGWYITRGITAPLCDLIAAAEALAHRDFRHRVIVHGDDELALLGNAFNYAARELQQLYDDLRRKEQELRDVINTVPVHVWTTSPDGAVDFVNDRLQQFLGLSSEDILGWNWESVLHPDERTEFVSQWRTAVKGGKSMQSEVRVRGANGDYCWFFIRNVPLRDDAGNVTKWYGSGIEIQDRKRAEEERERLRQLEADLAHMNRVSMMGELAASLAHEIKQPITATRTNARTGLRWLQRERPEIQEACEALFRIAKDIDRAAQIIDRNRSLYRRDTTEREDVDLNELIREMKVLLEDKARQHSISIRAELDSAVSTITADRVQVQQVLMNLMLNGIEAMKETGGELTVVSEMTADGQILVSVSDLGGGLPIEHGERIFDAFLTTKTHGTGMGLSISRRIVESHGGRLWATSNRGHGATFHVTLPRNNDVSSRPVA
jgi:PAS domain S-box-containing protein